MVAQEGGDEGGDCRRVVQVRVVAAAGQEFDPCVREGRSLVGQGRGDETVSRSPDDQGGAVECGQPGRQVVADVHRHRAVHAAQCSALAAIESGRQFPA